MGWKLEVVVVPVSDVDRVARDDADALDDIGFAFFDDPDGNGWAVQQIRRG